MDIQWGEVIPTVTSLGTLLFLALRFPSDRASAKSQAESDTAQTFQTYVQTVQDLNDRLLKRNTEVGDLSTKYDSLERKLINQQRRHNRLFQIERDARLEAEGERDRLKKQVETLQNTVDQLQKTVCDLQNPTLVATPSPQS